MYSCSYFCLYVFLDFCIFAFFSRGGARGTHCHQLLFSVSPTSCKDHHHYHPAQSIHKYILKYLVANRAVLSMRDRYSTCSGLDACNSSLCFPPKHVQIGHRRRGRNPPGRPLTPAPGREEDHHRHSTATRIRACFGALSVASCTAQLIDIDTTANKK